MNKQQPEALRLANVCSNLTRYSMDAHLIAAELRRLAKLEAEIAAVGAGGVSVPVREHDLQDVRCECCGYMTYHREHMGCIHAARAPADSVQGFRDGVASVAANAGSEPIAWLVCTEEGDPSMVFLDQREAQMFLEDDERPTPLYTHPSPTSAEGVEHG